MEPAVLDAPPAFAPGLAPAHPPRRRLVPRRRCREVDPHELVVDVITQHAESVLRIARRYSACQADAEDAYQRSLEKLVKHAHRLEPDTVVGWIRTVAKHEALALLEQRRRYVTVTDDGAFDALADSRHLPSVEERTERFDELARAAEALRQLKPQEQTALVLRAQGLSYAEIAERQNWTYTKVNRCVTEGRRALLARMEGLRTGAECERWAPVLSAMADGEATAEQLLDVRRHLRNCSGCRAVLGGMERATAPVAALLPVGGLAGLPAVAADSSSEQGAGVLSRLSDLLLGVQDRVTAPAIKAQSAIEAFSASKAVAAVAASAAVAGGGVAVERTVSDRPAEQPSAAAQAESAAAAAAPVSTSVPPAPSAGAPTAPASDPAPASDDPAADAAGSTAAAEFGVGEEEQARREFATAAARSEFGSTPDDTDASAKRTREKPADGTAPSNGGAGEPAPNGGGAAGSEPSVPPVGSGFESGARAPSAAPAPTTSGAAPKATGGGEFAAPEFGG